MEKLTEKIEKLISTLEKHGDDVKSTAKSDKDSGKFDTSDLSQQLASMNTLMTSQLDRHDQLIGHMRDNKDLTQKLLNVSM
jgi:hypothetical protein